MEIYYAIVNILDYLAKTISGSQFTIGKFTVILNALAEEMVSIGEAENVQEAIASIADANDAGGCKTWEEIVDRFRELHKSGERMEIRK